MGRGRKRGRGRRPDAIKHVPHREYTVTYACTYYHEAGILVVEKFTVGDIFSSC